jgi:hypothetical protein
MTGGCLWLRVSKARGAGGPTLGCLDNWRRANPSDFVQWLAEFRYTPAIALCVTKR